MAEVLNLSTAHAAAVLPAYETEATVAGVLNALPREFFQHIILLDNHSKDRTFEIASQVASGDKKILVCRNEKNLGYGGNLKKGFRLAMELGADIIVEIHPDGEYGLESVGAAIERIKEGAALVLGNRFAFGLDPLKNGMFLWKYPSIRAMNWIANLGLGTRLGDLHQGFRVYSSPFLKSVDFNAISNDYLFSFQIIALAVFHGFSIAEVPQTCHYAGKSRGCSLKAGIKYSLTVFGVLLQFLLAKRLRLPMASFSKCSPISAPSV